MACTCSYPNSCNQCGCPYSTTVKCVYWKGAAITCGDITIATQGDPLDEVITALTELACGNIIVSGDTYVVEGTTDEIDVVSSTSGNETTFTVSLSPTITDQILENTNDINTLETCVEGGVLEVTSTDGSVTITETATGACGRTLDLSVTEPSGVVYDGIIYNDSTKVGTSGGTGDKLLKSLDYDYSTQAVTEGDEIRFRATGQIFGDGADVDTVKIEVWDSNTVSQLYGESFGGFDKVNKQSWKAEGVISILSGGEALLHIDFLANGKQNGTRSTYTSNSQSVVDADLTGVDLTGLEIKVIYVHDSTSVATYNFARQLMVEVRKFI